METRVLAFSEKGIDTSVLADAAFADWPTASHLAQRLQEFSKRGKESSTSFQRAIRQLNGLVEGKDADFRLVQQITPRGGGSSRLPRLDKLDLALSEEWTRRLRLCSEHCDATRLLFDVVAQARVQVAAWAGLSSEEKLHEFWHLLLTYPGHAKQAWHADNLKAVEDGHAYATLIFTLGAEGVTTQFRKQRLPPRTAAVLFYGDVEHRGAARSTCLETTQISFMVTLTSCVRDENDVQDSTPKAEFD